MSNETAPAGVITGGAELAFCAPSYVYPVAEGYTGFFETVVVPGDPAVTIGLTNPFNVPLTGSLILP